MVKSSIVNVLTSMCRRSLLSSGSRRWHHQDLWLARHSFLFDFILRCCLQTCFFLEGNSFFFCDVCKYLALRYDGTRFVILIFCLMWYSESKFQSLHFWFEDTSLCSDESVIVEFAKRLFTSSRVAIRGGCWWDVEECFAPPLSQLMMEWECPK